MTFNNSILIIVKQNPGIDYNALLAKIAPRYKNSASAKSALMRALKDMASFGLIKRENQKIFITDKGLASISLEMKDKLVLRLNQELKNPMNNLEEILKLLIILSQRGAMDKDLLINAKENATFTIKDIDDLRSKIRAYRKYLKKMSLLIQQQLEKLKELDFNDSLELTFDNEVATKLAFFCSNQKIVVETNDGMVLSKIPDHWKKQGFVYAQGEDAHLLAQLLSSMVFTKATIYFDGGRVNLMAGKAVFFAPHSKIKEFLQMRILDQLKEQKKVESK